MDAGDVVFFVFKERHRRRRLVIFLDRHIRLRTAISTLLFFAPILRRAVRPPANLNRLGTERRDLVIMHLRHQGRKAATEILLRLFYFLTGAFFVWFTVQGFIEASDRPAQPLSTAGLIFGGIFVLFYTAILLSMTLGSLLFPSIIRAQSRILLSYIDLWSALPDSTEQLLDMDVRALLNKRLQFTAKRLNQVPIILKTNDIRVVLATSRRSAALSGLQLWVSQPLDDTFTHLRERVASDFQKVASGRWHELAESDIPGATHQTRGARVLLLTSAVAMFATGVSAVAFASTLGLVFGIFGSILLVLGVILWIKSNTGISTLERGLELTAKMRSAMTLSTNDK